MREAKIVIIGAGSASFGLEILSDLFLAKDELGGASVVLVDIDAPNLERVAALAALANDLYGAGYRIEHTTDRLDALRGAQFVITAVAQRREELWKLDFQVPMRHGVRHVLGENGGPGALFHAARSISLVLPIARDMEARCPNALLLNFTNPMSRVCRAVAKHTRIRAIGLCHQIGHIFMTAGRVFGRIPRESPSWEEHKRSLRDMEELFDVSAAGLNHFSWLLGLRSRADGTDLYPQFREKIAAMPADFEPLSRFLLDTFGLIPTGGDSHSGEYLSFAHEFHDTRGYDFDGAVRERKEMWERIGRITEGKERLPAQPAPSGERAVAIIAAMLRGRALDLPALNIPNDGFVANLPREALVEVPARVDRRGPRGIAVGELPRGVADLCRRQIEVQELVVEAAVTGDRKLALQALLLDPVVPGAAAARGILDELLRLEADALPMFA